MHPTSHPLDAEFQPTSAHDTLPPGDGADMVIQDFNSFFEKLSGLDDVRWSDDSTPEEEAPAPKPADSAPMHAAEPHPAPASAPKSQPAAAPAAAPRPMAAKPAADAVAPAHMAGPAPKGTPAPARKAPLYVPPPAKKAGLPLPFKLAMLALVLFAVGMGAGWLALSLPKTTDRSQLAENPLIPMETAKPGAMPNPWDELKAKPAPAPLADAKASESKVETKAPAKAPVAAKVPVTATTSTAANEAPVAPIAPKAPEFTAAADEPDAFSQKAPESAPKAPAPQAVTVELPKSEIFASAMASANSASANSAAAAKPAAPAMKSAPRATPPGVPAAAATPSAAGTTYAIQVGACSSARCVDNYRKIVQPHVGTHPIQVVLQDTGNGSVQRVRVEPLTKDQAESLRQTLVQADARLKNAYVVKVADRS